MIIFLLIILFLLAIALSFSVYLNWKMSGYVLDLETRVEESLDMLNVIYERIAFLASTPVMSDEPVVRDILNNIRGAREAVMSIARKLSEFGQDSIQDPEDEKD